MQLIKQFVLPALLMSVGLAVKAQTVVKEAQDSEIGLSAVVNTNSWRGFNGLSDSESKGDMPSSVRISLADGTVVTLGGKGVMALNQDASIKWNSEIPGVVMSLSKFKGKLIAFSVPSTDRLTQAYSNEVNAFLISPENGKILLTKTINAGDPDFIEQAVFFGSEDGSFSKVGFRLSNRKKKIDLTMLGKYLQQFGQTQSFTLYDLDENLEKKSPQKLELPEGGFGGALCNSKGDVFIRTIPSQNQVQISKFVSGNTKPVKTLEQTIDNRKKYLNTKFIISKANPSVVYLATYYENAENEQALTLSRLNFEDGSKKDQKEVITKDYLKGLEKGYVVVNEKINEKDLGTAGSINLFNFVELGDRIFLSMSSLIRSSSPNMQYDNAHAVLLKTYDLSLSPKLETIIPRIYSSGYGSGLGLHRDGSTLYVLANDHPKTTANKAIFGEVNLETGKVTRLNYLEKDKIEKANPADPSTVLWLGDRFIINYMNMKGLGGKMTRDVQVCTYK